MSTDFKKLFFSLKGSWKCEVKFEDEQNWTSGSEVMAKKVVFEPFFGVLQAFLFCNNVVVNKLNIYEWAYLVIFLGLLRLRLGNFLKY